MTTWQKKGREQKRSRKFMKGPDEAEASELVTEIYTPKMFNRPRSGSEKKNRNYRKGNYVGDHK